MGKWARTVLAVAVGLGLQGTAAADPLQVDYARLEDQRQSLESQRATQEASFQETLSRLQRQKAAWDTCVERTAYPARVCWEEPRLDAAARERALESGREALEALRGGLEAERATLEQRRRAIEDRFSVRGRGGAYESEFRGYMVDLRAYLQRTRDTLLPGYETHLSDVAEYGQFIETQASACPAPKPCEFAERFAALSDKRLRIQRERRALEQRLNASLHPDAPVPAMLRTAEDLWSRFVRQPRAAQTMLALERTRQDMERERTGLEAQRRGVERQRAAFERRRAELEAARTQLERSAPEGRRGSDYQRQLLGTYVEPMLALLDREQALFENYRRYEEAVLLYVYWVRAAVDNDPQLRQAAATALADYGAELAATADRVEQARPPPPEPAETVPAAPDAPAAVSGTDVAEAAQSVEAAEPAGQAGVAGVLVGLMRDYVGAIRDSVQSLGESS